MIERTDGGVHGSVRASVHAVPYNTLGDSVYIYHEISQHPARQGLQKHLQQKK